LYLNTTNLENLIYLKGYEDSVRLEILKD